MKLLFIIGTGRCGSTMVQEVLARHSDVGFISNVDSKLAPLDLLGRRNNSVYQRTPLRYTQRDRRRIAGVGDPGESHFGPSEAYKLFEHHVSPIVSAPFRDLTAEDATPWLEKRFRTVFERRMEAQGKPVFMHKFTGWPRAGFIHKVFPDARFVHVIRDGRAVANSLVQRPWWKGYRGIPEWGFGALPEHYDRLWRDSGQDFVVLAAIEWALLMESFETARQSVPAGQWMDVHYESFVENPRSHVESLFSFTELDWNDDFESRFERFAFTRAKKDRHHRDLTSKQIGILDEILDPILRKLGYEKDVDIVPNTPG